MEALDDVFSCLCLGSHVSEQITSNAHTSAACEQLRDKQRITGFFLNFLSLFFEAKSTADGVGEVRGVSRTAVDITTPLSDARSPRRAVRRRACISQGSVPRYGMPPWNASPLAASVSQALSVGLLTVCQCICTIAASTRSTPR